VPRARHSLVAVELFDEMASQRLAKIVTALVDHNSD